MIHRNHDNPLPLSIRVQAWGFEKVYHAITYTAIPCKCRIFKAALV